MIDRLASVPEFRHRRERHIALEEGSPEARVRAKAEITDDMVSDIFSQVDSLLHKADTLFSEIRRTANPFIPVHEDASEVRLALRALYPGGPDNRISFDQYMESLDYEERQARIDPIKIGDMMTGNRLVDSRILSRETTAAAHDDMSPEELLVIGGQFLVLAVCNRMLQTFQAPNTQAAVAGKMPPGTEAASTLMQLLIGIAAILLQTITNEQEVKQVLSESFGDALQAMQVDAQGLVDQAKAQEPDDLLKKHHQSRHEEYYAYLREYSTDYVVNSTEPGYEPWVAAIETNGVISDLRASKNEVKNYLGTAGEIGAAPYTMGKEIYRLMICRNLGSNSRLDKLGAVLSSKYSRDLVCCFVRFAGSIRTETLEQMRLLLQLAANGFAADLGAAFSAATSRINAHLERRVLEPILHLIDNFFRKMADNMGKLLDPGQYSNPKDFETLLICTPVDEAFTYILSALEQVRTSVLQFVRKYWDSLQMKNQYGSMKIVILADSKRARILLKLMDSVIDMLQKGNLCAEGDEIGPSAEDLDDFVDRIMEGLPPSVQLIVDGPDPYRTFSSREMNELKSFKGLSVLRPIDDESERGLNDCVRSQITDATIAMIANRTKQTPRRSGNGSD